MLKPEEITKPEFTKAIRGYASTEVDEFVEKLISQYNELYGKYTETQQKLDIVVDKYKQASGRATEAMNGVKQMSEAIINDAQAQGERIIADASIKAREVTGAMKDSCGEILGSYSELYETEKQKLIALDEKARAFSEALLEAYKKHIADIQSDFPSIDAEEIKSSSFETQVSDVFKKKLGGETSSKATENSETSEI